LKLLPRPLVLAAIVGCLVVAYPAAAWYTGTRIEARMTELSLLTAQYPNLKVVKHEFKRGVFTSTENTIIEFPSALFNKLAVNQDPNVPAPVVPPVQLHFINHITHGPIPGLRFGSASIDTELVLDDNMKAAAEKVFGQQAPLKILTKLNYFGGGSVLLSSPPISTVTEQTQDKIEWKGVKLDVGFSGDYKNLSFKLDAPGLIGHMHDGSNMTLGEISANGTMQQVAPGSFLYLGKSSATLDQLKVSSTAMPAKSFDLEKLEFDSDLSSKADLIDMVVKIGAKKLVTSKMEFSDFHYDYGIRHIDQATLVKLMDAIYHPPQDQVGVAPLQNVLGPWQEFGPQLLQNKPEFSIDRLSVSTPEGEAKLTAHASMGDATIDDLKSVALMMPKLQASATISVPEPMLAKFALSNATDPNTQAAMQQGLKQQIAALEQQGYVTRKDQTLSANIDWKSGQVMVNGKPMPGVAH
jgi:uncharacterized protein YdgA (DUF945 family)